MLKYRFLYVYLLVTLVGISCFAQEKRDTLSIADGGKVNLGNISTNNSVIIKSSKEWSDSVMVYFTFSNKEYGKFNYEWNTVKKEDYMDIMKYIHTLENGMNYVISFVESKGNGYFGKQYITIEFDIK